MSYDGAGEGVTSRLLVYVVLTVFAASIVITTYGMTTLSPTPSWLWHPPTLESLCWIAGAALLAFLVSGLILPRYLRLITVVAFLAVAISSAGLRATLSCLLIFASGLAL